MARTWFLVGSFVRGVVYIDERDCHRFWFRSTSRFYSIRNPSFRPRVRQRCCLGALRWIRPVAGSPFRLNHALLFGCDHWFIQKNPIATVIVWALPAVTKGPASLLTPFETNDLFGFLWHILVLPIITLTATIRVGLMLVERESDSLRTRPTTARSRRHRQRRYSPESRHVALILKDHSQTFV